MRLAAGYLKNPFDEDAGKLARLAMKEVFKVSGKE
jgi:hypothetical protein